MEALKRQRASCELSLTRLVKFAKKLSTTSTESVEELRLRANRAHELLGIFAQVEVEIYQIDPLEESKLMDAEESYYTAVAKLNEYIRIRGVQGTANNANDTVNMTVGGTLPAVKLAKLQIPHFSGDYMEWQSFFDLFSSSIHENENIPIAQKFQYLMGLLKGEAYTLVRHFKITEANYTEALQKLNQRYNRKRHTINAFIRRFIEQPNVKAANSDNIRRILDTSDEVVRGLKALSEQATARDPWLIYLLLQRLDDDTRSLWAIETTEVEYPTLQQLFNFLAKRIDALESLRQNQTRQVRPTIHHKHQEAFTTLTNSLCVGCNTKDHRLVECDIFNGLSVADRKSLVVKTKRCFNCLNQNHTVHDCKSRYRCRQCSRKHHSLLHSDEKLPAASSAALVYQSASSNEKSLALCSLSSNQQFNKSTEVALLPTALINIIDPTGAFRACRALLDTASQASFITESFVQKLGLPRTNGRMLLTGIGQTGAGQSHGTTQITITSRFCNDPVAMIKAFIISKITSSLPTSAISINQLNTLADIKLADPDFHKSAPIDMLLGADIVFELWNDGHKKIGAGSLVAQNTKLGWVIGGVHQCESTTQAIRSFTTKIDVDETLRKFWEIETIPETHKRHTEEEETCEKWFQATTTRNEEGRFITRLPFKENQNPMSQTYHLALSRLISMEKKFQRDPEFKNLYVNFMKEYQELGHMAEVRINPEVLRKMYILPHHGVRKDSSTTTKLRVVFDASAKCQGESSLNENLMVGPTVQSTLFEILLRFRQHRYVLVGDIEKMYRQVVMHPKDTMHQIILWRNKQQCIKPFACKTVTYGMASASFMATRCLMELAQLNSHRSIETCLAIKRDIYVDDLITGAATVHELQNLKSNVIPILKSGGFNLRKLASNYKLMQTDSNQYNDNIKQ